MENFIAQGIDFSHPGILPPIVKVIKQDSHGITNATVCSNANQYREDLLYFMESIKSNKGRTPILYTRKQYWDDIFMKPNGFEQYPVWVTDIDHKTPQLPTGFKSYKFWQYKDNGFIDGIHGRVDCSKFNSALDELKELGKEVTWWK